jgi:hypothetical protein
MRTTTTSMPSLTRWNDSELNSVNYVGYKRRKIDVYVVRVSRQTSKTVFSKPCQHCILTLKKYNVNRVFYTTGDYTKGEWACEKISTIENAHVSRGNRV